MRLLSKGMPVELALLGIFGAGVATFFTPCVLPLIPIYLSALVGADISEIKGVIRGQLLLRSLAFSLGFIIVFSLLGLGAASLGAFLQEHKAAVQLTGALIILIFALKFLGLLRVPFMDRTIRADDRGLSRKVSLLNALLMGVVFAAGWSPCVGPVLGSVLTYTASATSSIFTGSLYLSIYGLGFAVPLFVTALFAEAGVRFIRKVSRFLPIFEKVVGVTLIFTAAALLYGLADNAEPVQDKHSPAAQITQPDEWPLMVEFYSGDCPICERMAPVIDGLKYECSGNMVEIRQVDISKPEYRYLSKRFKLVGVPTFAFIDARGDEIARLVGEQSEHNLRQAISALRGKPCPGLGSLPTAEELEEMQAEAGVACDGDQQSLSSGACEEELEPPTIQLPKSLVPGEWPLLLEFYSSDCPICERMAPVVEALKRECDGQKVEIRQIDISKPEYAPLVPHLKLLGVPTFSLVNLQGEEISRLLGEQSEESLRRALMTLRGEPCPGFASLYQSVEVEIPED